MVQLDSEPRGDVPVGIHLPVWEDPRQAKPLQIARLLYVARHNEPVEVILDGGGPRAIREGEPHRKRRLDPLPTPASVSGLRPAGPICRVSSFGR